MSFPTTFVWVLQPAHTNCVISKELLIRETQSRVRKSGSPCTTIINRRFRHSIEITKSASANCRTGPRTHTKCRCYALVPIFFFKIIVIQHFNIESLYLKLKKASIVINDLGLYVKRHTVCHILYRVKLVY